ncbi:coiled-coil domain-containing protein 57 [Spea bombifrons]|uniref:coiled-coil domain-containing protein 57 n=1 Tax=Spea bombifrons TaxID=233779 RepID=UPI00234A18D3|nr:coiled-coil domain-containing protein 57 [Spea bombifrons]
MAEEGDFSELLAKKEQEWKDLQHRQVLYLERTLKETKKSLQGQEEKLSSLKKDFMHNLRVLAERDRDLERYELTLSRLKVAENLKQGEISDLKIQVEKLQQEVQRGKKNYDELQGHYQRKLKEHQMELERIQRTKNSDLDRHREEYEKVKRQLERKIEEVQGDLSLQKQELLVEFDSQLKKREHEFRLQLDELSTVVLSHELKAKLLSKELAVLKEMELKASETLLEAEATNQKLQEALKQKEFEIKELSAVKDARIKELHDNLQSSHIKWKREEETYQRKHAQVDRLAREKDSALTSMKEAHAEQIRQLEKQIEELQMCVETQHMEQRRITDRQKDLLGEKDATIEKLRGDVETLRAGWDAYIAQISKENVSKDLRNQALQEEEGKLKAQLTKYQKDIEKYQQQLAASVERERLMDQAKIQLELDWQKRCEKVEKAQYRHSEELIEGLTKAKEQADAELKEMERKLNEMKLLVSAVTWERDRATDTLRRLGAKWDPGEQGFATDTKASPSDFPSSEIQKLQEQNSELRHVIGQMRKEMESLCEQIPPTDPKPTEAPQPQGIEVTPDYIKSLEDEIQTLKQKNRIMEEQLQVALTPKSNDEGPSSTKPVPPENAYIQNYISSLNETIGALRADKVTSAAAAKRLEARTAHLDAMVTELTLKVQQKQAEVDQLQFQLNNETRHGQATISSLRQRQLELEMQLSEARREAEEYFKGNLQQNVQAVGLGNEVSALKLELAGQRLPVVLSETETVSQLREEILSLRKKLSWYEAPGGESPGGHVNLLQSKLKEAIKKIAHLSREKQQLIEMGNRLRAELASAQCEAIEPQNAVQSSRTAPSSTVPAQSPENHLSALENLQYQLTSQELQFAQYQKPSRLPAKHHTGPRSKGQSISEDSVGSAVEQKPRQKENAPPSPPARQRDSSPSPRPAASWLEGDLSLQDVWRILDMGSSPSLISSVDDSHGVVSGRSRPSAPKQHKEGVPANRATSLHRDPREKTGKPSAVTRGKPKNGQHAPKIRNYNVRD